MQKLQKILFMLPLAILFGYGTNDKEIVINLDDIKNVTTQKFTDIEIMDSNNEIINFERISDIVLGAGSDIIVALNQAEPCLVQLDKNLKFKKYVMGQAGTISENNAFLSIVYYNNNYYVVDDDGMRLQKYDKDVNYITSYKISLGTFYDITFINDNEILSLYPLIELCNVGFGTASQNETNIDSEENKHIFCIMDTLGNIIRYFGDIEGNEEGLIIEGSQRRDGYVKSVYDPIYKQIFLISQMKPIIRRFDLNGNLLQQINIEGEVIDKLREQEKQPSQVIVKRIDKEGNIVERNVTDRVEGEVIDKLGEQEKQPSQVVIKQDKEGNIIVERDAAADGVGVRKLVTYLSSASITEGHRLAVYIPELRATLVLHYDDKNIIDTKIIKCEIETEGRFLTPFIALKDFNNMKLLYDQLLGGNILVSKN